MSEIICPHCQRAFTVDESGYADLVRQVRDAEFEASLEARLAHETQAAVSLAESQISARLERDVAAQRLELETLHQQLDAERAATQSAIEVARLNEANSLKDHISALEAELTRVRLAQEAKALRRQLAEQEARRTLERERDDLARELAIREATTDREAAALREAHERELRMKDEQIERYRDFKARLSTKMLGESLEQHCETEFNRLRAAGFSRAYFERTPTLVRVARVTTSSGTSTRVAPSSSRSCSR
jgi:hypothetical protein